MQPLPATITELPPRAILASFDFEGSLGKENYKPGCSMSLGIAAFNHPYGELFHLGASPIIRWNIKYTEPLDEPRRKFWAHNQDAYHAVTHLAEEPLEVARKLAGWHRQQCRLMSHGYGPVIFISSPHPYDGQHTADLLAHLPESVRPKLLFADIGVLLDNLGTSLLPESFKPGDGKKKFKELLGTKLSHVPDADAFEQARAYFNARSELLALSKAGPRTFGVA